jgi:urease beta subunit
MNQPKATVGICHRPAVVAAGTNVIATIARKIVRRVFIGSHVGFFIDNSSSLFDREAFEYTFPHRTTERVGF